MDRLRALSGAGVSIWLDTLSRDLLDTGAFAQLIREQAVTGATSNPTIFAAAITHSARYDTQLARLVAAGEQDLRELFFALALEDVRRAADLLRPVYDATEGADGFVSFQCTPELADDSEATISQARALWSRIGRPNAMIKVAATSAGVRALEVLTADGLNINMTLLFSVARYAQVLDAYQAGLERRLGRGESLAGITSVASFFVSRVDARVDPLLSRGSPLLGRVGVANAGAAYGLHREHLSTRRWRDLAAASARPQRPLWASTATKNADYPDLLYVESLIAPGVINTMTRQVLDAFADHGEVPPAALPGQESAGLLSRAAAAGLDLPRLTDDLERDGVRSFCSSYEEILDHLARRAAGRTGNSEVAGH